MNPFTKFGLSSVVFGVLSLTGGLASAEFICTVSHIPSPLSGLGLGDFGSIDITFNSAASCGGSLVASHTLCSTNATSVACARNTNFRFVSHEQTSLAAQMLVQARVANLPVSRTTGVCNNNSPGCLSKVNFGQ